MEKESLTWKTGCKVTTVTDTPFVIPQEVAEKREDYAKNKKTFWALSMLGVYRHAVILNANEYGKYATGMGDIIIRLIME